MEANGRRKELSKEVLSKVPYLLQCKMRFFPLHLTLQYVRSS